MTFKELTVAYRNSADYAILSKNSKVNYDSKMSKLIEFGGDWRKILQLNVCNSTKNVYLSVLKVVYKWACREKLINSMPNFPDKSLKTTAKDKLAYTKEEINAILWVATSTEDKIYANFAAMAFHTGCRPSELYTLTWDSVGVDLISLYSTKRHEIGQIGRKIAITGEVRACLDRARNVWIELTGNQPGANNLVFRSLKATSLTQEYVRHKVKAIAKAAGVIGNKQLRHCRSGLATAMYKAGYSVYDIQGQLGHSSIGTTERYIRPSLEDRAFKFKGV